MNRSPVRRRGALLLCVLGCLMLLMLMFAAWSKTFNGERRYLRARPQRMQAESLVQSGLRRAAAQLAADRTYSGETWSVPAEALPSGEAAEVQIRIEPGSSDESRLLSVVVQIPAGPNPKVRREAKQPITLPKQEPTP